MSLWRIWATSHLSQCTSCTIGSTSYILRQQLHLTCQHPRMSYSEPCPWCNWLASVWHFTLFVIGHLTTWSIRSWTCLWLFLSCHTDDKSIFVGSRADLWLSYLVFGSLLPLLLVIFPHGAWRLLAIASLSCYLYIYKFLCKLQCLIFTCANLFPLPWDTLLIHHW